MIKKISKQILYIYIMLNVVFCGLFAKDSTNILNRPVDLIVFSYDRPLQLYACLESIKAHVAGFESLFIIYRASDKLFETAYQEVQKDFPWVKMFKQDSMSPKSQFKSLFLDVFLKKSKSKYVAFVVDDIIVKDSIDLSLCVESLKKNNAYGFYLRLGKNITENYTIPFGNSRLPDFKKCKNGILSWRFKDGTGGDWSYPNTLDMTIYRKDDIAKMFSNLTYTSPNSLESCWAKKTKGGWLGLCFEQSKIVNIPLNKVQQDWNNKSMDGYPVDKLLRIFNGGYKIDIQPLYKIENKAPHIPYEPMFVLRHNTQTQIYDELKAYKPSENRHIVVITTSYKNKAWVKYNLDSIFKQKYPNFDLVYIDDVSPDGTGDLVEGYIKENKLEERALLIKNTERCGAMANIYKAVYLCEDDDIIVTLDGDDWFATDYVLELVNKVYNKFEVWMTYGNYKCYPGGRGSVCAAFPREIIESNSYREYRWCASSLRTFYAGLFKKIKIEDLMYENKFFPVAWDLAVMYPMLEMSGGRFMFIADVLYIYNIDNPINDYKVNLELQQFLDKYIRHLPKYSRLKEI